MPFFAITFLVKFFFFLFFLTSLFNHLLTHNTYRKLTKCYFYIQIRSKLYTVNRCCSTSDTADFCKEISSTLRQQYGAALFQKKFINLAVRQVDESSDMTDSDKTMSYLSRRKRKDMERKDKADMFFIDHQLPNLCIHRLIQVTG